MSATSKYFTLNNGAKVPAIAFGTWVDNENERPVMADAVYEAIKVGYRHIDCAQHYRTEKYIGQGIKRAIDEGIVTRSELFVTTKVWPTYHRNVSKSLAESLSDLGLDYVDLFLQHWPLPMKGDENGEPHLPRDSDGNLLFDESATFVDFYKCVLKAAEDSGKVKNVGVSNFNIYHLEKVIEATGVVPAVNQVEMHVCLPQWELQKYCKSKGIHMEGFSVLGAGGAPNTKIPMVKELASKYDCSPANIIVSFLIKHEVVAVIRSVKPHRLEENAVFVDISDQDMAALATLGDTHAKRYVQDDLGLPLGFDLWVGQK